MSTNTYNGSMSLSPAVKAKNIFIKNALYILFVALIIVFSCINNSFFSIDNLFNILIAAAFMFATTAGSAVVIVGGNMDLTVGSAALVSAGTMYLVSTTGAPVGVQILVGLLVGLAIGLVNGLLVAKLKFNSMVLTLGLLIGYRGVGLLCIGGSQVHMPSAYQDIGRVTVFGGLAATVILCIAVIVVLHIIMRHTKFGTYVYAIGCNESAARQVGISVDRVKIITFIISGLCAALAGFMVVTRLGMVHSYIGNQMEFDAIEAAVIGGISLKGGRGNLFPGVLFGVLLLYVINNGMSVIGASEYLYPFAQGIIVFVAMYLDSIKNK